MKVGRPPSEWNLLQVDLSYIAEASGDGAHVPLKEVHIHMLVHLGFFASELLHTFGIMHIWQTSIRQCGFPTPRWGIF
jgi:hypothetical protein